VKKIVKKWGDGIGIYIDKEEQEIYKLKEGDIVDVEIVKVKK
jgi:hypothetical protein